MRMRPIFWALLGLVVALVDLFVLRAIVAQTLYWTIMALAIVGLVVFFVQLCTRNAADDEAANVLLR